MNATLALAVGMVRSWAAVYTFGLPKELRSTRRWEIDSDVWEQRRLAEMRAEPPFGTAVEMAARTLFGVISDITWRVQAGLSARPDRSIKVNDSWIMRGVLAGALLVALVPIGFGVSYLAGGGEWGSTFERVAASLLWIALGLVMGTGLLLSRSRSNLGLGLLAVGVIGISVMLYWAAVITVPIGLVLLAIAYIRAGRPGWPRGAGTA